MRGDQLSRQWRILRQIEVSKNGLTAAEIAELGGVTPRTAYRDLDDLQLAGFPLFADMGIKPYKDYARFREIISTVNQAALERCSIEMLYLPLRRKKETHRKIDPYKIWFLEGTIYIIGFCHLRDEVRTFVVDRIKLLKLTDEKFVLPNGFDLDEFTRHSFKVIQDELNTVKVRITPAWARYIGEKIWHESQRTRKLSDGSLELTFQVAGLDEIKQWIMSLGPEVYVEEPERLRDMVKADMKKALVQYEGIRPAFQGPAVLESQVDYAR